MTFPDPRYRSGRPAGEQ